MALEETVRRRLRVRGTVQGVGFRPYVYKLATELGLTGYVLNDPGGVVIEVEGAEEVATGFAARLTASPPPLSLVTGVELESVPPQGSSVFEIRASRAAGEITAPISADAATCAACVDEIFDPTQRRFRYAFTNCTNCGPRFTIATAIPYDRANTTMSGFAMCEECRAEYEDPSDRRFHAQPVACPRCGPTLHLVDAGGTEITGDPITSAAALLEEGGIVAVKGLGGYHLACNALSDGAVTELRRRKAREEKPLAVMAPDLDCIRELVELTTAAEKLLTSPQAPIVLAPKRNHDLSVAEAVAPANRYLGVMLPYTPVHHLLLAELGGTIVLTSGNISEEPMAYRDADARTRLKGIADAFLGHDRPIRMRCDDSVLRLDHRRSWPIRRARGYAPSPLAVAQEFRCPVLGAGPELKHTFCLGIDKRAIISHHIGDLENFETMEAFTDAVEHFTRIFSVEPEVVAHDLHPEYLATKWALGLDVADKVGVQHHHAHIASCLADNMLSGPVIGVAMDGTGFGDDGTIWGCEVMTCDTRSYDRLFHLRYVPLPGAAAAIREPWRMGAVYLDAAFGDHAPELNLPFVRSTRDRWAPILQMVRRAINSPPASSTGRLFDAAAALCGLRETVSYEGQAAIELEQVADVAVTASYDCSVQGDAIDGVELVAALAEDLARGRPVPHAAAMFHNGLADAISRACAAARDAAGLSSVALSGGSFQNMLLLRRVSSRLSDAGFDVLVHRRVPPNDGGISLGQVVVANAKMGRE
ncbi:MAG TPA: carbamoyltransferase HypF [Actinomycetota bacterium]|jgi:hydrogenase maturation protein HypF|nr:carbamoyltransferase HypF [Actinomycetota bacterium]